MAVIPAPAETPRAASELVYRLAEDLGFGLVGIADARPASRPDVVRQWLAEGRHGEMTYLAENLEVRLDPGKLLEGAQSVIAVADAYASASAEDEAERGREPRGRIARYAWGDDYHKVIKKRLHTLADTLREAQPQAEFRCVVDTAPAMEREHATRAGLGWTGKHTLLIHPRYGSYFLLGVIVTTLPLESSRDAGWPARTTAPTDHCGTCTRCIDACPTQCIIAGPEREGPRSIDAARCLSYLTLEHRSPIDPSLHEPMGDWIAGCDICQEVCPHNLKLETRDSKPDTSLPIHPRYAPRPLAHGLPLMEILDWTPEDRQRTFTGSALKRVKLDMLKRNALIALGNHLCQQDAPAAQTSLVAARDRIMAIARDPQEPELVRITARQVLDRLERPDPQAASPPPPSAG